MTELVRPRWAMILGGASCVWDDVQAWEEVYGSPWDGVIIAANDIGAHWPREFHHWVSLHPLAFKRWKMLRTTNRLVAKVSGLDTSEPVTWGKDQDLTKRVTDKVLKPWVGGSSGMFAVQVAEEIGCTRAILCGVPMTPTPHFAETKEPFAPEWQQASAHWRVWPRHAWRMLGWVKSMSGRTQELLGAPTLSWLLEA